MQAQYRYRSVDQSLAILRKSRRGWIDSIIKGFKSRLDIVIDYL